MSKQNEYIFVLWGNKFEEITAAIFVAELRKRGFLVKVVGLNPVPIKGANGLALTPDLMLGEALLLAAKTRGVIVPALAQDIAPFKNDPRLKYFLYRTCANQARMIIKGVDETDEAAFELFPTTDRLAVYTAAEDLPGFVHRLTGVL